MEEDFMKLTWNICFKTTMSDMLKNALIAEEEEFSDVTLVCDDKYTIKAHKFILATFSPVLKNILMNSSESENPVISLCGFDFEVVNSLIEFIYLGKTDTCEKQLDKLYELAKSLEIKVLTSKIVLIQEHFSRVSNKLRMLKNNQNDTPINNSKKNKSQEDENIDDDFEVINFENESPEKLQPKAIISPLDKIFNSYAKSEKKPLNYLRSPKEENLITYPAGRFRKILPKPQNSKLKHGPKTVIRNSLNVANSIKSENGTSLIFSGQVKNANDGEFILSKNAGEDKEKIDSLFLKNEKPDDKDEESGGKRIFYPSWKNGKLSWE